MGIPEQSDQREEDKQNQDVMLRTILGILSFMVLTDARKNLADLRDLESNLLGITACFLEPERIKDIRIIDTPFTKYQGHVAILQLSATKSYVGHDVVVADLLNLPISQITWGDQGRQYAFVLGKGSIDSPEEVEQVLSETLKSAINHWKSVKGELASMHNMK